MNEKKEVIISPTLFWIDLEMTGLDPAHDVIIEIASLVTDNNLTVVAEGPSLVIHQPDFRLDGMDEWNTTHHGESGLTDEVKRSTITLNEAYERTLTFAREHCEPDITPVCGNSVYQDRAFLRRLMPELDQYFSYRIIDVSSIKEVVRRWYPTDPCMYYEKETNHRALGDVHASIEELKHYRKYFFRPEP